MNYRQAQDLAQVVGPEAVDDWMFMSKAEFVAKHGPVLNNQIARELGQEDEMVEEETDNPVAGLDGRTERVGEALAATAKVGTSKVWFNFASNVGTVTWDLKRGKWYGAPRLIPQVKKAFGL